MKQATVLVLALALAACGGKGSSGTTGTTGKVSLSAKVAASAPANSTAAVKALAIGDHVTLDRARVLIRKVTLEAEGTEQDSTASGPGDAGTATATSADHSTGEPADTGDSLDGSSDSTPGDDAVVRAGPLVIDLSGSQLDGGVALLFDQPVPAGTYEDLTFQIRALTPGESVADTDFQPLGHSIILDLLVDGTPFQFTTDLTAVSEASGPLVVPDGGTINVTVTVDPGKWFTAPDGSFLDPRVEANRSQLEWNIKSSIRGFEDDDHDGEPDHG